mgnify:CR=1 FL=1
MRILSSGIFRFFMIVWSIWLVEVCIGAILLLYRTHRKLYDLKMKNGWIGSNGSKIMTADSAVDATVSAQSEKWNVSVVAYLFCGLIVLPCLLPQVRLYLKSRKMDGSIFVADLQLILCLLLYMRLYCERAIRCTVKMLR